MGKKLTLAAAVVAACAFTANTFAGTVGPPMQVPEPGTLSLLALGIAGVAIARLKKRK